jgi:hypothetical protein
MGELAGEIAEFPSHSWAGVAAKATTLKAVLDTKYSGALEDGGHCVIAVIPSLIDDIARLSSGAPARPGMQAPISVVLLA